MSGSIQAMINREIKALFELKKSERLRYIPLLASLCIGIPLFTGLYLDNLEFGITSCLAGLVILYLPPTSVPHRMLNMLAISFGFMVSFTVGICFSFNYIVSSVAFAVFAIAVNWVVRFYRLRPPGSFFFVMIASIASTREFDIETIPTQVGLIGMGAMLASILALIYSLIIVRSYPPRPDVQGVKKDNYVNLIESIIIGTFTGGSLLVGHLLELHNPYWLPISCAAVLQGISTMHVWQRTFHRILGTFIGLGLMWVLLLFNVTPLIICIAIVILQFAVEILIVRHYTLAVVFITPMTILIAEAGSAMSVDPTTLISVRFLDIVLGSVIGAIGGWLVYHERILLSFKKLLKEVNPK